MNEEHLPRHDEDRREFHEEAESLWRITLALLTWVAHFVTSYGVAAVICAKAFALLDAARIGLVLGTVTALTVIFWLGWRAWRQRELRHAGNFTNAMGEADHRHQFMGHVAVLLAMISAIGVIYGTLPVLLLDTCR